MRRSIVFVVVVSMMLAGAVAAVANDPAQSMSDGVSPPGPLLAGSHAPCQGGETVLVIQDNVEWFVRPTDDQRGNVVTELIAQEKNWCAIHSNQFATAILAPFGEIIIPSAQVQSFYDNLFPGGAVEPNLDAWVVGGGILSANLADHATGPGANGNWDGDVFVGGVQHVVQPLNNLTIADAAHPIITGTAPCPSGNCGGIVDGGPLADLDGWGDSAHGFFTNLPAGTTVILEAAVDQPVMIEYPHGSGVVVATLSTSEYMYAGDFGFLPRNKKLLSNEIAYQDSLLAPEVIDTTPPEVVGTPDRAPNSFGWYGSPVLIDWVATDPPPSSGTPSDPPDTLADVEGAGVTYTSAPSCDPAGLCGTGTLSISLDQTPPSVQNPVLSLNPKAVADTSLVTALSTDSLSGVAAGEFFIDIDPGLGAGIPMDVSGSTLSATIGTDLTAGVYTLSVRARDRAGNWSETATAFLVVYDPDGGFVTGGGWIDSPEGAYTTDPSLTGKANFGFVSEYKKGSTVPTGQTEFQFKVAELNFHSSSYDWLVIAGPNAKYKGTGTINGSGNYGFILTACDVAVTGNCEDKDDDTFRIKIWNKDAGDGVVYDNKLGASDDSNDGTVVDGGNIKVHKG